MMEVLAELLAILATATAPSGLVEDDPLVLSMSGIARVALLDEHPECLPVGWDFRRGEVIALGLCEWAGWFYQDDDIWKFEVTGS